MFKLFFLAEYIMKRHTKGSDGKYHIHGKKYSHLVGSRAQVYHGTAYKTTSSAVKPKGDALVKKHLLKNKHDRIVSAVKSKRAKSEKRLEKAGYFTRKGKFGWVKKKGRGTRRRRRRHRRRR